MKTGGNFHRDLEKDIQDPEFEILFRQEKERLQLNEQLKDALNKSHLSVRKVAHRMGTSKSQIERMIHSPQANIGINTLIKFANATGRKVKISVK